MKDIALAYAAAGWPVLWVYGMRRDEEGNLVCTCGLPPTSKVCNPKSTSRGKHPPMLGHGAHDATTDPAVIEAWPWHEGPNVGIAGRDCNPIIDIDDPDITAKLLEPEFGLRDMCTVSTTGRGLHIYMQCAPSAFGNIKNKATGERIGEVRAHGAYVVAPPSMHYSGTPYRWIGDGLTEQGPTVTDKDAWAYIGELLASIGVEIVPRVEAGQNPFREETVEAVNEIPYQITDALLQVELTSPHMFGSTNDRSGALYKLACDLVRDVRLNSREVSEYTLAGIIKAVDIKRGAYHPGGPKYAFRSNADDMYWSIIHDAVRAVNADEAKEKKGPPTVPVGDGDDIFQAAVSASFFYDVNTSQFLNVSNPKRAVKIANFEPKIVEEVTSWSGDDDAEEPTERIWNVRLTREDHIVDLKLARSDFKAVKNFTEALQAEMPSHFVITDGMAGQLYQGIKEYSGVAPVRRALALSGWVPNRDAFLLPGAPGAITPDGFDTTTRFESVGTREARTPARFFQYGWSVTPKDGADLASVVGALFSLREPSITVPVMNQILGAPLASLGVGNNPTVLHLFARTGSFKSTIARVLMSVFGRFTDFQADQVEEWKSTDTSLQATMYRTRDLPLLVDDFKLINFNQNELGKRIHLIQNYADRTGRTRSTTRQAEQDHHKPRCLMISTGEDVWDGQESAVARTLVIDASLPDDREKVDALKRKMSTLRDMAQDGLLGALGYEWIHWLVTQGRAKLVEEISDRYRVKLMRMEDTELGVQHPRVAASVSMLLVVSSLFADFLAERIPEARDLYKDMERNGWGRTILMAAEKAEQAKSYSPYYQLVNAMIDALASGEGYLAQRLQKVDSMGNMGAEVMGYIDHEAVWVNENTTLGWYRRLKRKQGLDALIQWDAFVQEAKRDHEASTTKQPTNVYGQNPLRLWRIPLHKFFGEDAYQLMMADRATTGV